MRLIPQREDQIAEEKIGERKYQADVVIMEDGPLIGKSLKDAKIAGDSALRVVKLIRGAETVRGDKKLADLELQARDELFIEGLRADLLKIKDIEGLDFKADVHLADPDEDKDQTTIVEGVLLPRSPLIGQSLRSLEFKGRYGLQVLAIHRAGRVPRSISSARLRMGDVLLLQGTPDDVKALERGNLSTSSVVWKPSGSIARALRWRRPSSRWQSSPPPSSWHRCPSQCWAVRS